MVTINCMSGSYDVMTLYKQFAKGMGLSERLGSGVCDTAILSLV